MRIEEKIDKYLIIEVKKDEYDDEIVNVPSQLKRVLRKYKAEESGSGSGMGGRDISYTINLNKKEEITIYTDYDGDDLDTISLSVIMKRSPYTDVVEDYGVDLKELDKEIKSIIDERG
jgi:hypothetical protein